MSLRLALLVALPAALAGCHHSSSGASGGGQPASTGEQVTSANDSDSGTDPSGGEAGRPKAHAPAAPTPKIVINQPTPEPMAPPPVAKAPTVPALPVLPHPNKYPKQASVPKGPDTHQCGEAWSGTEWVTTECLDPDAHKKEPKAARVVIPYDKMRPHTEALPSIVDHRSDGTEGPVRRQGGPQCTAFAFTAALDHAYARWTGQPGHFSVMQVWSRYHRKVDRAAANGNVGDSLANESDWPYDAKLANSWLPCATDSQKNSGQECGKSPDADKLAALDKVAVAEITNVEAIPSDKFEVLREKLAAGQDVVVALKLESFATAGDPGAKYVVGTKDKPDPSHPGAAHVVVLAGYANTPNGYYYLVHNSFGTKWGDGGYAWLHEELIKSYSNDSFFSIPDLEPKEVAERRARAHGKLSERCEKGKAPDSISGMCASKCADGSPRHNNVCVVDKKECPAGMVNLTGECLMAAPKSSGKDDKSGVKWECGPGGCTYDIPKDKLDCKERECAMSCPAPTFRLATMQKQLVCVE